MSGDSADKEIEVKAELVQFAIQGRRLRALDELFPDTDLDELQQTAEALDENYSWFRYRVGKITISDIDAARQKIKELRDEIYST